MKKGFLLIALLLMISCASCNNPTPETSSDTSSDSPTSETTPSSSETPSESFEDSKDEEPSSDKSNYDNPYSDGEDWHRIG